MAVDSAQFIKVMACSRVGRLENPFHFFESRAPAPGAAYVSQVAQPQPGREPGRVLLSFEEANLVGVMVTSSMPGWSSATVARYSAGQGGSTAIAVTAPPSNTFTAALATAAAAAAAAMPANHASRPGASPARDRDVDALCHIDIRGNGNFSRTVDLIALGEHGLVEFVQLNAQHEPQLIWYRPLTRTPNPWRMAAA